MNKLEAKQLSKSIENFEQKTEAYFHDIILEGALFCDIFPRKIFELLEYVYLNLIVDARHIRGFTPTEKEAYLQLKRMIAIVEKCEILFVKMKNKINKQDFHIITDEKYFQLLINKALPQVGDSEEGDNAKIKTWLTFPPIEFIEEIRECIEEMKEEFANIQIQE